VKKIPARFFFLFLMFFAFLPGLYPQSSSGDAMVSTQFDMTGFPQWTRDLRRAEIVAFGAFPFAYFFSNFGVDLYRCGVNGWDMKYAPWPAKGAGAIEQTKDEKIMTLGIAAGGAVCVALIDFGIEYFKRNRRERAGTLPEGTPIINRRPLNDPGQTPVPEPQDAADP
jgi:hypothetical protein